MAIGQLNLPNADAIDYNGGDVDYLIATDPVFYVNANRPHKNLAHRDNLINDKSNQAIQILDDSAGTENTLTDRLAVSLNPDGTLINPPGVDETIDMTALAPKARADVFRAITHSGIETSFTEVKPISVEDAVDSSFVTQTMATKEANTFFMNQARALVNGYRIDFSKYSSQDKVKILLNAPPANGTRQDFVFLEAWLEEVVPGASDAIFYPFGNTFYGDSTSIDGVTLENTSHSGGNFPEYDTSTGYHCRANDPNISEFLANPAHNVGLATNGYFVQMRWRLRVVDDVSELTESASQDQLKIFAQGQTAAPGSVPFNAIVEDAGIDLADDAALASDGKVYAMPMAVIHRRNTTAWAFNNRNGNATALVSGVSDRPDGLFNDEVTEHDVKDLRHKVYLSGISEAAVLDAARTALFAVERQSHSWESAKMDPSGTGTLANIDAHGTSVIEADVLKGSSAVVPATDQVMLATSGSNGAPLGFNNLSYVHGGDEEALTMSMYIEDENDGIASRTHMGDPAIVSYNAVTHSIEVDLTLMPSGVNAERPQFIGLTPSLKWEDGVDVNVIWSTLAGDQCIGTIQQSGPGGYDAHDGEAIFGQFVAQFPKGSDFLTFVPTGGSFKSVMFTTAGVDNLFSQITYNKDWAPYNSVSSMKKVELHGAVAKEPVITTGIEGTFDTVSVGDPSVVVDGATQIMYYTANDGTNDRIFRATSTDGTNWSNHALVINLGAEGSLDTVGVRAPKALKIAGTFHMWYTGYDGSNQRIIHCTSADGITFAGHQVAINIGAQGPSDADAARDAAVVYVGGQYKMLYVGEASGATTLISCDSLDGITWSNQQVSINPGDLGIQDALGVDHPTIMVENSQYHVWYTGTDTSNVQSIVHAYSLDGVIWFNFKNFINAGNEGTADRAGSLSPAALVTANVNWLWYTGLDTEGTTTILASVMVKPDVAGNLAPTKNDKVTVMYERITTERRFANVDTDVTLMFSDWTAYVNNGGTGGDNPEFLARDVVGLLFNENFNLSAMDASPISLVNGTDPTFNLLNGRSYGVQRIDYDPLKYLNRITLTDIVGIHEGFSVIGADASLQGLVTVDSDTAVLLFALVESQGQLYVLVNASETAEGDPIVLTDTCKVFSINGKPLVRL